MNRVALFAHFDAEDEVKPYVVALLRALSEVCTRVVLVSTSKLGDAETAKLRPLVERVILRENVGYDFAMWKDALDSMDLTGVDELVLSNSSVFGPIFPLAPIVKRLSAEPCDFWGMTDSTEHRWHLQSYFIVFKRKVLESDAFHRFWESVLPYQDKTQVILSYELGLTQYLTEHGFRPGCVAPLDSWAKGATRWNMERRRRYNATLFYPLKLIRAGMPFVKVNLLRDNVGKIRLGPVLRAMTDAGYDSRLHEFATRGASR